jgi:hypothetical protein
MPLASFDSVVRLPPEEKRRLLERGDDPERLWSAWAIALELGRDAVPLLSATERGEIAEGLRQQLLVVLAGLGERRLLRTSAESAPSSTAARRTVRTRLR